MRKCLNTSQQAFSGLEAGLYHLTPQNLVGQRFRRDVFGDVRIALVGYCPPPAVFSNYAREKVREQHFIHLSPNSIRIVSHENRRFLSLAHVYGGPVSSATIEELAFYGIEFVLAYGLAGGLGTKNLSMGDFYLVESALAADGTTRHYSGEAVQSADKSLCSAVREHWQRSHSEPLTPVRAATGDAIYRESDAMLDEFRQQNCDIINLDSSHLFAAANTNSAGHVIRAVQCGVLSDIVTRDGAGASETTLSIMLSANAGADFNPLEKTGDIVRFYIEELAPQL